MKINPLNLSIRGKLLLISAVLIVVPLIGVQYIQDMEDFLRANQESNLLARAQVVAAVLESHENIFKTGTDTSKVKTEEKSENNSLKEKKISRSSHLYVRPLKSAVQLDGYLDEWNNYANRVQHVLSKDPQSVQYNSYVGTYKKYLYVMFEVTDDVVIYRQMNNIKLDRSDHLKIVVKDSAGQLVNYIVTTQSPGWINAQRVEHRDEEWVAVAPELRIKGEWQQTAKGYNVEIRIPLSLIGDNLAFFIADIDNKNTAEIKHIIGSTESITEPGSIIIPSLEVESLLTRVVKPASRTWVLDKKHRVLAVAGSLRQSSLDKKQLAIKNSENDYQEQQVEEESIFNLLVRTLYQILLKQPTDNFHDELSSVSYLQGKTIQSALQGNPAISWRETPDKRLRILTVSYPVLKQGKSIGAIAIEETSNSILILQNRAMEILINLSMMTFFITVTVLLSYATHLSVRIRRLRDEAEQAITSEGRISNLIKASRSQDEIGDLSRSFSGMLSRLEQYNRYLETMSGKLSHELRTPITVVRSSLENLEIATTEEARSVYIQRASEGMERLSDILTRMSEATRLEQTLQAEICEQVSLSQLIENCTEAYRQVYPSVVFELKIEATEGCLISAAPELLVQMLDKLISNAVDFHKEETSIKLCVVESDIDVQLSVTNQGALLPEQMQDNLFESMVSVRTKKGNHPHLGLGLYIVRMIVEFHNGTVTARNIKNNEGVEIRVVLPK